MPIAPRVLGLAAGLTAALVSTICAFFLTVAPSFTTKLFGLAVHQDLSALATQVTWTGYLVGLVFWGVGTGLAFGFAAWLYDRMAAPASRAPAGLRPAAAGR